jgi:hypothetical protein
MTLNFTSKKTPLQLLDYLGSSQKFVSVHPIISQMDDLGNSSFLVHETLQLGPLPFSFTYKVSIEKNELEKTIRMHATVFKFTRIHMLFSLKELPSGTAIEEYIEFKTLFFLKPILQSIFKTQHTRLFQNIEAQKEK